MSGNIDSISGSAIQVFNCIDGKYKFNFKEFENALQNSMDSLVAFYSIAGPFRTGKSFMLGFFHRYLKSKGHGDWITKELPKTFTYRGGCDRETVGIWMWSEPFIQVVNGKKVHVFLLDTQGCFDAQTKMKDNAVIFALSTLMSSVMVFNISKQLSEDILKFFEFFAGYTKLAADTENRDEPFQQLLFLIRDWEFHDYKCGYYDDDIGIEGKNFKRDRLNVNENMADDVKYVHGSIMSMYKKVGIYLLPHPGKDLARDSMFNEKVDDEFLQHLRLLVTKVLNPKNIINKKINGCDVIGRTLITFVKEWVKIYENNLSPETETLFLRTAEHQNEMAKTAAFNDYTRRMNIKIIETNGMSEMDFNITHNKIFTECLDLFGSISGTSEKIIIDKYVQLVKEGLASLRSACQLLNRDKYEKKVQEKEHDAKELQKRYIKIFSIVNNEENPVDTLKEVVDASAEDEDQNYHDEGDDDQEAIVISHHGSFRITPSQEILVQNECSVNDVEYEPNVSVINEEPKEPIALHSPLDQAILAKLKEVQGLIVNLNEQIKPAKPKKGCAIS